MSKIKTMLAAAALAIAAKATAANNQVEQDKKVDKSEVNASKDSKSTRISVRDKTLSSKIIRDGVKETKYTSKSLSNDGMVFVGVHEDGTQESRSLILNDEQKLTSVRKVGNMTTISNYLGNFEHDASLGKIQYTGKNGETATFYLLRGQITNYNSNDVMLKGDLSGMIQKAEKAHAEKVVSALKNKEMTKIDKDTTYNATRLFAWGARDTK